MPVKRRATVGKRRKARTKTKKISCGYSKPEAKAAAAKLRKTRKTRKITFRQYKGEKWCVIDTGAKKIRRRTSA